MVKLKKLFEPGKIGNLEIKNRIVYPAVGIVGCGFNGEDSDRQAEYYKARARGGAGLIILGAHQVDNKVQEAFIPGIDYLTDYKHIPFLAAVVSACHIYGAKVCPQLVVGGGRQSMPLTAVDGRPHPAPSAIPCPVMQYTPREITKEEIRTIVEETGRAATISKMAGFDAIELHAAHGYLMAEFMSSWANKRTDEYGGPLRNRVRFLLECIEAIKKVVGDDFPLIVRYCLDELVEGGRGIDESVEIAKMLVGAGVHAIDASAGVYPSLHKAWGVMGNGKGLLLGLTERLKKAVPIPVIAASRMDPFLGEKALEEGKVDFVAFARPLIADPDLPNKVRRGKWEEVRKCIYCNQACLGSVFAMTRTKCTVNPLMGNEIEYKEIRPALKPKRVTIIGAGPGGMEAARVTAMRGHDVSLYEKTNEFGGGQLKLAAVPPTRQEIGNIVDWYSVQLPKYPNLKICFDVEVTADMVRKDKPDVVIVATGAEPVMLDIIGVDRPNVCSAWDILSGKVNAGKTVVVGGGGSIGCGTAEFLADQGKKVTLTTRQEMVAYGVEWLTMMALMSRLAQKVKIMTKTTHKEVTAEGALVVDAEGKERLLKADTIVYAAGTKSVKSLYYELLDYIEEAYLIGDARQPRLIGDAIWEGFAIAAEI